MLNRAERENRSRQIGPFNQAVCADSRIQGCIQAATCEQHTQAPSCTPGLQGLWAPEMHNKSAKQAQRASIGLHKHANHAAKGMDLPDVTGKNNKEIPCVLKKLQQWAKPRAGGH